MPAVLTQSSFVFRGSIIKQQMIPQQSQPRKKPNKKTKQDLLKLERPIYELKRNEEGNPQSIIAKLMQQKQKPQIGFLPRSQLFQQLNQFIPILKQSNQQLLKGEIKPEMQFDAKLEQVEDSSSSDEQQGEEAGEGESGMEVQVQQQFLSSVEQFQFNILKYPYLPKEEGSAETKEERPSVEAIVGQSLAGKFQRIVEVHEQNPLEQLE